MKHFFTLLVFCGTQLALFAQTLPVQDQYLLSKFVLNPAVAGLNPTCTDMKIIHRQQWLGIKEAPTLSMFNIHSRIGKNIGLGGRFFNDKNGFTDDVGLDLAFAYHLKLSAQGDKKLSFGMALHSFQHTVDETRFNGLYEDPAITGAVDTKYSFDLNAGMYLILKNFTLGFSAANLLPYVPGMWADNPNEPAKHRYFFTQLSYNFNLGSGFNLEMMALHKTTDALQMALDINPKLSYTINESHNSQFWFLLSYQMDLQTKQGIALVPVWGYKSNNINFAVAYDFGLTPMQQYHYGTVSVMVGYLICRSKKDKGQVSCPAYE